MLSEDLESLAAMLRGEVIPAPDMVARALENLAQHARTMEAQPVPAHMRLTPDALPPGITILHHRQARRA